MNRPALLLLTGTTLLAAVTTARAVDSSGTSSPAAQWRTEHRLIDVHQHIDYTPDHLARAVRIMDRAGIGIALNLSGGSTVRRGDQPSEFERNKELADRLFPGRFMHSFYLDYRGWDQPDWPQRAVSQVDEGFRLGAAGLKEFKRLGLYLRDGTGKLIPIDDPKLDPVWKRCGELGLPVSIHVADPKAFWLPYEESNERWKELKDHRAWWFGDTNKFPPFDALLAALNRVIARHPATTFICVHFANCAEDLDWVEASLDRYPNMMADLAARIPEIGRHAPEKVRRLFEKHADRILFATDFQVYDRLILGSSGNEPPPSDDDAAGFFDKHWRWLETNDRQFDHMTPIQGDWKIDAIGLPAGLLRRIYFDNARRVFVRQLPLPLIKASRVRSDRRPSARLDQAEWRQATPVRVESSLKEGRAVPAISTTVRALWSKDFLYLGYECPFRELTVFPGGNPRTERSGLWDRDVVEAFIAPDPSKVNHYFEFEVAPDAEKLDLELGGASTGLTWNSGWEAVVRVDKARAVWRAEMRIPIRSMTAEPPRLGTRWRLNLYRHDIDHRVFLAWSPTARATAHTPTRFGVIEFIE